MDRRRFLAGGAAAMVCCSAHAQDSNLAADPKLSLSEVEQELHSMRLLAALHLVFSKWRIAKAVPQIREEYAKLEPGRVFGEFSGYNIGALIISPQGEALAFALNRNHQFNSPFEHAEVRAVRAAIRIANNKRWQQGRGLDGYAAMLQGFSVYTTLESCTQCSGVMDLANIATVVYAQEDPGQKRIGNILYNLLGGTDGRGAPLPVRANFLPAYGRLTAAYDEYRKRLEGSGGGPIGMTSFLGASEAYLAYREASATFEAYVPKYPQNMWAMRHLRAFASGVISGASSDDLLG